MNEAVLTLNARQVAAAQTELRAALGLEQEQFPLPAVIGMLSDEIEQLRARGFSDADIAKTIRGSSGLAIGADDVGRHYAPPEARRRPGE